MKSDAATVDAYLEALEPDRRAVVAAVRDVVVANLPEGYVEQMTWGMISYVVPLECFPKTYNGKPLSYAALAAQKHYYSLYLTTVYADSAGLEEFESRYRASGKRLDMGKSCVRFRKLDDLPLDLIADVISGTTVDDFIALYERARAR